MIVFDKSSKAIDCCIPFVRHLVEHAPRLLQPVGFELPDSLPPPPLVFHETGLPKRVEMLGDRLTSDTSSFAEMGRRGRSIHAEPRDDADASRIAERGKYGRCFDQL